MSMHNGNGDYVNTWINEETVSKPCVALIRRPDGRTLTSAMLGELNGKMLASLGEVLDVALATLQGDGSVSIKFPTVGSV